MRGAVGGNVMTQVVRHVLISVCAELSPADLQVCWAGGRRAFTASLLAAVDPVRVPETCLRRTSVYALNDVKRADIIAQ